MRQTKGYLRRLNDVAGLDDRQRAQAWARVENVSYMYSLRFAAYRALARWLMRLSPGIVLLVWLTLFLIVRGVPFLSWPAGVALGSAASAAVVFVTALGSAALVLGAMTFGLSNIARITWRRLVVFMAAVAVFETAIGEAYDHHSLPATGWWSWIVLGLVAAPAVAACMMAGVLLGDALAWSHIKSAYRTDCLASVMNAALQVLDGLDSPAKQDDYRLRLRWAVQLEDAASLLKKYLVPPAYLGYLSSRDWVTQRLAGWAEALYHMQRQILVPSSSVQPKVKTALQSEIRCSLPWQPPPIRPPRLVSIRQHALAALRALVVAALPIAAVLVFQPVLQLSPPVFSWARIATGIWALLYVVITLDPAIRDKIDTARSLVGVVQDSQSLDLPDIRRK